MVRRLFRGATVLASVLIALLTVVQLVQPPAYSQIAASGSLSGTVFDPSGAIVPNARVVLKNEATNGTRETVSNSTGYFSFPAVQAGSYTVTVSAPGFTGWEQRKIVFNQGENRTLPNVTLKVGAEQAAVQVVADADAIAPIDTGESRQTLNTQMITELAIQGRSAAELIKIMPGMGMNTGLGQGQWNSLTTGTNSGPVGQFTANGTQPNGGLSLTTDGANIVDPGNQGTQIANINQDQTAEVSLLNSAYGAEYAKGPVVFQAISKGGGSQFHGGAYLYARNGLFNAEDSFLKNQGVTKPNDSYYYPGGTIGGPVLIPHTNFNKNRDKLFFFAAYEYMKQQPAGTLRQVFVPTSEMLGGNFSPSYLASLGPAFQNYGAAGRVPCGDTTAWNYANYCQGSPIAGGIIPKSVIDPNSLALAKLFPAPNQDPATHGGNNYGFLDNPPQNRWEFRIRGDYNISEKTKAYVSYTRQRETDINNFGVWWWPGDTLPYPSKLPANTVSNTWSANVTHVFSPSLTNEAVFTYASYINPVRLATPSAVDPSNIGFTGKGVFSPKITPQIPNLISWGCNSASNSGCFPGFYAPAFASGFANGAFGALKRVPAIADNLSKVAGSHMMKFGFYWDFSGNKQTSGYGSWAQGAYDFDNWGTYSTGNPLADFLVGKATNFTQVSADPVYDMRYKQIAFYGQDQWKATRRLTLTYGFRFDHLGQWYPGNTPGLAVWDPAKYDNTSAAGSFTGLSWNDRDKTVPRSGFASRLFYPSPRVGVAYDLFGNGRTILRGGFGVYRYQLAYNDVSVATDPPLGILSITTPALASLSEAATFTPSTITGLNGNISALQKGDDRTPYAETWNFIVSQRMPGKSVFEIQYAGNRGRNLLIAGNGTGIPFLANLNKIPVGALFGPDPKTGVTYAPGQVPSTSLQNYRPYANYGQSLNVIRHGSYSNYNALILSWQKQSGRMTFTTNYTFSKVLGIRDGQTNNGSGNGAIVDAFNIKNNYGVLAFDRTHIFNAAYVINLPSPAHGNRLAAGTLNGWEISGITQFQSGPPLQPNRGGTLNVTWPTGISNQSVLGTDSQVLVPSLTCDPRTGLKSGQYFNPNCFAIPAQGTNGSIIWPYIKGSAYFNSDLSIYKNFKLNEKQKVQFRFSAFNFLNHALPQFGLSNDLNLVLGSGGTNTNTPNERQSCVHCRPPCGGVGSQVQLLTWSDLSSLRFDGLTLQAGSSL